MMLVPFWGFWISTNLYRKGVRSVPDYDNRQAEVRRADAQAKAEACYQSFKAAGRVCSGCNLSSLCKMEQDSYRWLFQEFMPAITKGG